MTTTYTGSDLWHQHIQAAADQFTITTDTEDVAVRHVEAEAGTGSRYTVTTTRLSPTAEMLMGGPVLVTVTSPWCAAYALQRVGVLYISYVAEKFIPRDRERPVHGGDLAALTLTIAHALDRQAVIQ